MLSLLDSELYERIENTGLGGTRELTRATILSWPRPSLKRWSYHPGWPITQACRKLTVFLAEALSFSTFPPSTRASENRRYSSRGSRSRVCDERRALDRSAPLNTSTP